MRSKDTGGFLGLVGAAFRFYAAHPITFAADVISVASLFVLLWGVLLAATVLT